MLGASCQGVTTVVAHLPAGRAAVLYLCLQSKLQFLWHPECALLAGSRRSAGAMLAGVAVSGTRLLPLLLRPALSIGLLGSWPSRLAVESGELGMLCICSWLIDSLRCYLTVSHLNLTKPRKQLAGQRGRVSISQVRSRRDGALCGLRSRCPGVATCPP